VQRLGHSTRKLSADELADLASDEHEAPPAPSEPPPPGVPGPLHAADREELTDPGLQVADAGGGLRFDDETHDEAADSVMDVLGWTAPDGSVRSESPDDEDLPTEETLDEPAAGESEVLWSRDVADDGHPDAPEAFTGEQTEPRDPTPDRPRELTNEIGLDEVELLEESAPAGVADADLFRTPGSAPPDDDLFRAPGSAPVDADSTGELSVDDLEPVDPEATDELAALDPDEISGLVELPDDGPPRSSAPPPPPLPPRDDD